MREIVGMSKKPGNGGVFLKAIEANKGWVSLIF